ARDHARPCGRASAPGEGKPAHLHDRLAQKKTRRPMTMHSNDLLEITDANFDALALQAPLPVLIDFTAAWCAPCRAIAPPVDAIATAYAGRLRVGTCDVDAHPDLVAKLDVRSMPTLLVSKDGRVFSQLFGAAPRAKLEALVARALT